VKPVPFTYVRAESAEHAVETLRAHGDEGKILAGGQSLLPALNMRLVRPGVLVDLNFAAGLDDVTAENGSLRIGALVRQAAAERSELVRAGCPLLAESLPLVGHVVTRNRGTVCGSIAHADSAAELPLALVALGGEVVTSRRTVPALEEFAVRHGDFALASAACVLHVEQGHVTNARLAVGSVTDRPELVDVSPLVGQAVDVEAARTIAADVAASIDPPPNLHGSPEYRRRLSEVVVERVVARAWAAAT
jgi:CO/xanthine dehydrogenase FAD-binding subunit